MLPSNDLGEDSWQFADAEVGAIFDKVKSTFADRLDQVAEIFVGVQTSADRIYIFRGVGESADTVMLRWNGVDWPIERGVLRPCLNKVQLSSYGRPVPNAWMIFPYENVTIGSQTEAKVIAHDVMAHRFPGCMAYLEARREELSRRNFADSASGAREFYEYGRSQSLSKFSRPKIILPALSVDPKYIYDDSNIVVTGGGNGPYYLIRQHESSNVTNYFLLGVLSHPLSEAFVRMNTSVFRGGYYSHGKQYIKNLPIPSATDIERHEIEGLVVQMIDSVKSTADARTPHQLMTLERQTADLKRQIEVAVTRLFGLSDSEMDIVRAIPVPA